MKRQRAILAVAAVLLCFAGVLAGDETAPIEPNKAIVRSYIERIINEGDWSAWSTLFPESISFNGQTMSKGDMQSMVDTFRTIFPDLRMRIESQIAEGDTVATRVTISGTHEGDYMGMQATGEQVSFSGLTYDRIRDGKVVEMWHEMNLWGTLLILVDD